MVDFNIEEFTEDMNLFIGEWDKLLIRLKEINSREVIASPDDKIIADFKLLTHDSSFSPDAIAKLIISSVFEAKYINDCFLLSNFVVISFIMWPIMPSTSEKIWEVLGFDYVENIKKLETLKIIKEDISSIISLKIGNIDKDALSSAIGEK